ncbi:MAG: hypothetical protein U5N58_14175 [Actinomycetota bacterium]|nr:hypothetical protein [Actinomycetota bacterium]
MKMAWSLSLTEAKKRHRKKGKKNPEYNWNWAYWIPYESEHCSYKHTKKTIRTLIHNNSYVFRTEKSEAGAVIIPGTDYVSVFKIESHNHPARKTLMMALPQA